MPEMGGGLLRAVPAGVEVQVSGQVPDTLWMKVRLKRTLGKYSFILFPPGQGAG